MNINELIKGIIIGIAKIIPGLSGAVLMISFNLYDRAIDAITNFFVDTKRNFWFLFNLGIGIIIGIVLFSKVIVFFLSKYYFYTTMFFIGLILGGMPMLCKKVSINIFNCFLTLVSFFVTLWLFFSKSNFSYVSKGLLWDTIVYFFSGILEAIGTVIPGISSTALLMLVGVYEKYLYILGNVFNLSLFMETMSFVLPFSIGLFLGIIAITLIINYLFKYYQNETFACILGISFSSVITLMIRLFSYVNGFYSVVVGLFILGIGYFITNKLS